MMTTANVQRVYAAPTVSLDANSVSTIDNLPATALTPGKTARVGVVITGLSGTSPLNNVFGWQFTINYVTTAVTAQADPPAANDPLGIICTPGVDCSEAADATVKVGSQTVAGSANWQGLMAAGKAFQVVVLNEATGKIQVGVTLLDDPLTIGTEPDAKDLTVDTLLANVAFELDSKPATAISFTLSDVIIVDHTATPIPGITIGGAVTWTISNTPPVASATVSNLTPTPGEMVTFTSTSTDADEVGGIPTGFVWDFGFDADLDGLRDLNLTAVGTYRYPSAGTFKATLRVRDTPGATGSARDQLGDPIGLNGQPSHVNFTLIIATAGSPVLNPIGPKTVNEQTLLTFTATATDPDGELLTFSLGPGAPSSASINPSSGVFSWTPAENQGPGSPKVTVIVSDPGGLKDNETITITVNEVNQPPSLTVPATQNIDEQTTLTFTVNATDPDIPANTITFTATNLPAGASFNATARRFTWTPTEAQGPGTYTVSFNATDNGTPSLSNTKSVTINVNEVNAPPTASFTVTNPTPARKEVVGFDASTSSDPDPGGSIASYEWNFGDGNITTVIVNTITHKYTTVGSFTVTLKVTDNVGTIGTTTKVIAVVNQPPTISAIADKTEALPGEVITLTLAYADADGDPLTVTVNWGDGTVDPVTGNTASHAYTDGGRFVVVVTVTDGQGDPVSTSINVTVGRPSVSFTASPSTAPVSVNLALAITSSDPSGIISTTKIEWGDGSVDTFTGARTSATHAYTNPGTYTITVTVMDNTAISASSSQSVTITRQAPALTITPDKTEASTDESVTVAITGSDPDGVISSTKVDWGDGTIETLMGPQTSAAHKYAAAGTYTITVTVTDNSGITTTRTSTITISQAAAFPLPGGPIPWAVLAVIVAGGILVYVFKIRKPAKVTAS